MPSKPDNLIVAFENGTIQLFDRRKLSEPVVSNQNAHQVHKYLSNSFSKVYFSEPF